MQGVPPRESPRINHLLVGLAISAVSYVPLLFAYRRLLVDTVAHLLSAAQITTEKFLDSDLPFLAVRLSDGSCLDLAFTWQRSGVVSVVVFGLLFIFLLFPLEGRIWLKLAWLELGILVGLAWGFLRISIAVLFAYCFGNSVFGVAEFLLSPFTDFFWILSLWSLGLSSLISAKHNK